MGTMLQSVACALALAAGAWLAIPAVSDAISVVRRLWRGRSQPGSPAPARRLLALVPAHDEALLIEATVSALRAASVPGATIETVVIADNCSDDTAAIARKAGATVHERRVEDLRGKPHAIAWGLTRVDLDAFDGVCIVDGDCVVDRDFARRLAAIPDLPDTVVQPRIDVSNPADSPITALAAFYGRMNNGVAFSLKSAVGLSVPIGAGMCLGRNVVRRRGWTAFSIAEDWELYAQCVAEGVPIRYAPTAVIRAQETKTLAQGKTQRARWQSGKTWVCRHYLPAILGSRRANWTQKLDAAAELTGIGPVGNAAAAVAVMLLAFLLEHPACRAAVVVLASLQLLRLGTLACFAFPAEPRKGALIKAAAYLPVYAAWRIVTLVGTLVAPPGNRWIRADRHAP